MLLVIDLNHGAALVRTATWAGVVGKDSLTALGAGCQIRSLGFLMRAPFIPF